MKQWFIMVSLFFALNAPALARAELPSATPPAPSSPSVAAAQASDVNAGADSLLIPIVDTSPSVRSYWKQMRDATKAIIQSAPEQTSVAMVGIDAEAVKSPIFPPAQRAEALAFVDTLDIGGRFTDLARGTDAALALAQQAGPAHCVLVFLTDGQLSVPQTFRNRANFYELLRREFATRGNVTVLIVNVRGDHAGDHEALPPNVRLFALKSADELRQTIAGTLTATIKATLKPAVAPAAASAVPPPNTAMVSRRNLALGALAITVILVVTIVMAVRRKTRATRVNVGGPPPTNLLQQEELTPPEVAEPAEPVALLAGERLDQRSGHRTAHRYLLRAGQQIFVGNSAFAELSLPGLKQAQTMQVAFDGSTVTVWRLRPQRIGELDQAQLNQQAAAPQFTLTEQDRLTIGDYLIRVILTTADAVPPALVQGEAAWHQSAVPLRPSSRRQPLRQPVRRIYEDATD